MAQLWQETIDRLQEHNKTMDDVIMICGNTFQMTKETFEELAHKNYDEGYGSREVCEDLKLIGKNFIMVRDEYDGAEWWRYIELPNYKKFPFAKPKSLFVIFEDGRYFEKLKIDKEVN